MKNNFYVFQKWTFDYLNNNEVDGMCAIIIFNAYQLLLQNGINVENITWFDSDTIQRLADIDEKDEKSALISFHLRLFKKFNNRTRKDKIREYDIIQNAFDKERFLDVKKKYSSLFDNFNNDLSLLIGCLLELYRKYDLLTGNSLFRLIVGRDSVNNEAMKSAYSFLCMQQNPVGYFGFYMKRHFDIGELRTMLCISFDCIAAILKYKSQYKNT